MAKINCLLEMELGITGGEEDGVNNEGVDNASMYSQPDEIWQVGTPFLCNCMFGSLFPLSHSICLMHAVSCPEADMHSLLSGRPLRSDWSDVSLSFLATALLLRVIQKQGLTLLTTHPVFATHALV